MKAHRGGPEEQLFPLFLDQVHGQLGKLLIAQGFGAGEQLIIHLLRVARRGRHEVLPNDLLRLRGADAVDAQL